MDLKIFSPASLPEKPKRASPAGVQIVLPGELITSEPGFMRGHGTYQNEEGHLFSCQAGVVERVNKLISVRPIRARYVGDVGDVIVGRITELQQSKWKVDIAGRQDAVLQLGAVNLPGAARRRTIEDQLQMRSLFVENDVICAEVQSFFQDGSVALQVGREMGKLEHGLFMSVPSSLIRRAKTHFHTIAGAVDLIIGMNGCLWLSASLSDEDKEVKAIQGKNYVPKPVTKEEREKIARVKNCIEALAERNLPVHPDTITECYRASLKYEPKHLISPDVIDIITKSVQISL